MAGDASSWQGASTGHHVIRTIVYGLFARAPAPIGARGILATRPATSGFTIEARKRMTRKVVPVLIGVALACAAGAWAVHAADESVDTGPVRLLRNLAPLPTNPVATLLFGAGVRNCAA